MQPGGCMHLQMDANVAGDKYKKHIQIHKQQQGQRTERTAVPVLRFVDRVPGR